MSTDSLSVDPFSALPAATSPRAMRRVNRAHLLDMIWHTTAPFTASDLIELSGLTRATVLQVCRDLEERGWIREVGAAPGTTPGRQALRFEFDRTRTHIAGVDIGRRSVTAAIADLSGAIVGRATLRFADHDSDPRGAHLDEVIDAALADAGLARPDVSALCIGVAAPVGADGAPPDQSWFWSSVAVDAVQVRERHPEWRIQIENDANLAAMAEAAFTDELPDAFVALLSGERLGAGIILGGRLHRGSHGGAGEMEYLEHVAGVDGSHGIAALARMLAAAELDGDRPSILRDAERDAAGEIPAPAVLHAADDGDELALAVVEQIGARIALVIATIANVVDPARVVIAGGIAAGSGAVAEAVRRHLPAHVPVPPDIALSTLGRDVVLQGALRSASNAVRSTALASDA